MPDALALTGRCYCGAVSLSAPDPLTVVYCHCSSCRRLSGAPVAAFAAFTEKAMAFNPPLGEPSFQKPGVTRWSCPTCSAQLAATYDYLPDQIYVPIGLFDQADTLEPQVHAHAENQLPWLHLTDDLPRKAASSRDVLNAAADR